MVLNGSRIYCSNTVVLNISACHRLEGTLPTEIVQLSNLGEYLKQRGYNLARSIWNMQSLSRLVLTCCCCNGNECFLTCQNTLSTLNATIATLHAGGNSIGGTLPSELGRCSALSRLALFSNVFSGMIPSELGRLENLRQLSLKRNNLSGSIPEEICDRTRKQELIIEHHANPSLVGCS